MPAGSGGKPGALVGKAAALDLKARAARIMALRDWLQELLGPEAALLWQAVQARSGIETHLFRATLPWRCRHAIHEIDGAENGPHPEGVELWRAQVKDSHFHERALAQATIELVVAA